MPKQDTDGVSSLVLNDAERWCIENDPNITDETLQKLQKSRTPEDQRRGQWCIEGGGATRAVISMSIKYDLRQTLSALISAIARDKRVSFTEAAGVLCAMRRNGQLGYYHVTGDRHYEFVCWAPPDLDPTRKTMSASAAAAQEPVHAIPEVLPPGDCEESEQKGERHHDRLGS